ncbi:MAG: hypothetical protein MJ100_10865, partial [Ruminococcus sp.]|nr:hypothetical protein [Ruminococcus sp.]
MSMETYAGLSNPHQKTKNPISAIGLNSYEKKFPRSLSPLKNKIVVMNSESAVDEFFARIRSAGFFARLFSWKKIRTEAEAAYRKIKDAASDAESAVQESRIKEDMLTTLNEEKD